MEQNYDLVVIGGGPGGYVAAERAAQNGLHVLLAEQRELGGTCLNRGCIPTKVLLKAAHDYTGLGGLKEEGVLVPPASMDFGQLKKHKEGVIKRLRTGVQGLLKQSGVEVVQSRARFAGSDSVFLEGPQTTVKFQNALIATGSAPALPPIPGLESEGVYTSDEMLAMEKYPQKMLVLGGGVIGVEFASILAGFGCEVQIAEMMETILPEMDGELSAALRKKMEKEGVVFSTSAKLLSVKKEGGGLSCEMQRQGKTEAVACDGLLVASGRRANTEGLDLAAAGIRTGKNGAVQTDERLRTEQKNIYAIGDVRGEQMLAHAASAQGACVADTLAGRDTRYDPRIVPGCVYTQPEAASVGLTEDQAKAKGVKTLVGKSNVLANGKALIMGEKAGFAKLVADAATGEILGAHLLCPRASDMIGELCLALRLECTVRELAATVHPHPTVSEMICEAAADACRKM
ncbi:dihydrolipoyl dehydrogenase [Ruminococcaceae bacterium OttesenSCG-928-I18]|nr:dihydrolipoyl dehydrogenase [Ruminococcaceae bacterium OttesenSCG-928-I18]